MVIKKVIDGFYIIMNKAKEEQRNDNVQKMEKT